MCFSSLFSPLFYFLYLCMASRLQLSDRWYKRNHMSKTKGPAVKQRWMAALCRLLPHSWQDFWLPHALGFPLACLLFCLLYDSLIPILSVGSQNLPFLTLSQAGQSFPRLSTGLLGAGFWMEAGVGGWGDFTMAPVGPSAILSHHTH